MAAHLTLAVPLVPDQVAALPRETLDGLIEGLLRIADEKDGDSDLEPNGDELDGDNGSEDDFMLHERSGPGCPIADGPDATCPEAYSLLTTHCRWTERGWRWETGVRLPRGEAMHDDAEEDDHGGCEHDGREPEDDSELEQEV